MDAKKLNNNWKIDTIEGSSGNKIRYGIWQKSPPTKYIVYFNGRTEWIEKNSDLPELLNLPDNCGFLTWDHRGQGASDGRRGHVDNFNDFIDDAKIIIDTALNKAPYVILAHSMGGLISINGLMQQKFSPQKMILSSPFLMFYPSYVPIRLLKLISNILCFFRLGFLPAPIKHQKNMNFKGNEFTSDKNNFDIIKYSPYPVGPPTFKWIQSAFKAIDFSIMKDNLEKISIPISMLIGTKDTTVEPKALGIWIYLAQQQTTAQITLDHIHMGRHELFFESPHIKDQVINKISKELKDFIS